MTAENAEVAVRSHNVLVTSGLSRAAEFEPLINLGAAVRLAINLRGMPPIRYLGSYRFCVGDVGKSHEAPRRSDSVPTPETRASRLPSLRSAAPPALTLGFGRGRAVL